MKRFAWIAAFAVVSPCLTALAMPGSGLGTRSLGSGSVGASLMPGQAATDAAGRTVNRGEASTDSPAVHELQLVEDKWSEAFNQRDQYGLELVLAPLYMDVSQSGVFSTRNQQIANLITNDDRTAAMEQRVLAARVLGDVAIATGTYTYRHKGSSGEMLEKGVFTHVFQRQHGQWMCISSQETAVASESNSAKPAKKNKGHSQAEMPFHIPFFSKGSQNNQ